MTETINYGELFGILVNVIIWTFLAGVLFERWNNKRLRVKIK